jgi:hypothetical protein
MGQGNGDAVCRIGGTWGLFQSQYASYHLGDLPFLGSPHPDHRFLHGRGRVFRDYESGLLGGE